MICISIKFTDSLLQYPSDSRKTPVNDFLCCMSVWTCGLVLCFFSPLFSLVHVLSVWSTQTLPSLGLFIKKCTRLCYFGPLWWLIWATDLCDLSVQNTILSYLTGVWKGKAVPAPPQHEAGTQVLFCGYHFVLSYRCVEECSHTLTQTTWGRQEHRPCLLNAILSLGQHGAGRNTGIVCLAPPQPTLQVCGGVKLNLQPYVMEQEHEWFLSTPPSHPTLQVWRGKCRTYTHTEAGSQALCVHNPHWSGITSSVCS